MEDKDPFAFALAVFKVNIILLSILTAIYLAMDQGYI